MPLRHTFSLRKPWNAVTAHLTSSFKARPPSAWLPSVLCCRTVTSQQMTDTTPEKRRHRDHCTPQVAQWMASWEPPPSLSTSAPTSSSRGRSSEVGASFPETSDVRQHWSIRLCRMTDHPAQRFGQTVNSVDRVNQPQVSWLGAPQTRSQVRLSSQSSWPSVQRDPATKFFKLSFPPLFFVEEKPV